MSIRKSLLSCFLPSLAVLLATTAQATVLVNFESLTTPPALDSSTALPFTNSNNTHYLGVDWDPRLNVTGRDYRVDPNTPGPLYGIPHSGDYYVGNHNGADGIILSTSMVLLGAWFARNEYYGFGGGADQITITALSAGGDLLSLTYPLPEALSGQPEIPSFFDTSAFAALSGITGYRIDRHATSTFTGDWIADDFSFTAPSALSEPSPAVFLPGVLYLLRRRRLDYR